MDANKLITIPAELLTPEVKDSIAKTAKVKVSEIDSKIAALEAEKLTWTNALSSILNGSAQKVERTIQLNFIGADNPKYPKDGKWIERIRFIIWAGAKPLQLSEIVSTLLAFEPNPYGRGTSIRTVTTRIASLLSIQVKEGRVIKREKIDKEFLYGLSEWFDGEAIKAEYRPGWTGRIENIQMS